MEIHSLPPEHLLRFIERMRKFDFEQYEKYLHSVFQNTLSELGEFVPCDAAIVLLDDPMMKRSTATENELVYVAGFGGDSQFVLGKRIPATSGLVAEIYVLGKSILRKADPREKIILDRATYPHPMATVVGVPLKIENAVVGVLFLCNKKDPVGFTLRDLKLVEIFSGYISTSIQNAIDSRKSQELSKKDDLTGLYNDRHFHRQLEIEVRAADENKHPLCLLFMDLDSFKQINDRYGHLVGSQTLKEVGFILREAVNNPKATLARYGGDEYVIILPGASLEGALETAETIRKMIVAKLFMIDQGEQDGSFINFKGLISCSVGISSLSDHVFSKGSARERKVELIRLADQAMYRAKETGKNRSVVASI
ncbi:MAG: sensor domain-containing diguanylate cyclase [Pseudomonadota bacterium]